MGVARPGLPGDAQEQARFVGHGNPEVLLGQGPAQAATRPVAEQGLAVTADRPGMGRNGITAPILRPAGGSSASARAAACAASDLVLEARGHRHPGLLRRLHLALGLVQLALQHQDHGEVVVGVAAPGLGEKRQTELALGLLQSARRGSGRCPGPRPGRRGSRSGRWRRRTVGRAAARGRERPGRSRPGAPAVAAVHLLAAEWRLHQALALEPAQGRPQLWISTSSWRGTVPGPWGRPRGGTAGLAAGGEGQDRLREA